MILGVMNPHQQQEAKTGGFPATTTAPPGATHQSMPNFSSLVWESQTPSSSSSSRNPFLPANVRTPIPTANASFSHKRSRDGQSNPVSYPQQPQQQPQLPQQNAQFHPASVVMMNQPFEQPLTSTIQWMPMTPTHQAPQQQPQPYSHDSNDRGNDDSNPTASSFGRSGKKCRSNRYRAPRRVEKTFTSQMGTLVGGTLQQTSTSVQMRRQLSGGHLNELVAASSTTTRNNNNNNNDDDAMQQDSPTARNNKPANSHAGYDATRPRSMSF